MPVGKSRFVFEDAAGDPSKRIPVYVYRPAGIDASTARIVFVMHGHGRNAEGYRETWIEPANHYGFIVVAPLFDAAQWPHGSYASASVEGPNRDDPSRWSYSVVELLFDAIRRPLGDTTPRYDLYGHSEGAQFVHRLVLMLPNARYARAVAANADWYTMPRFDVRYPFGLEDSPVDEGSLRASLGRDVVVLLGDRDIDPNHPELNRSREAEAQGANRFERGHAFFDAARRSAETLRTPFGWQLRVVHGAAHQNSRMSPPAAALLMDVAP